MDLVTTPKARPPTRATESGSHTAEPDASDYCRQLETYLCRKNDGHLIRIVGPAFEQVCGWAARGVPVKLAMRGIDRYFERYYAKGPRRRPVRIEFCEADIFDVFDDWRRSVGVGAAASSETSADDHHGTARGDSGSLPAHLERVVARLTIARAGNDRSLDLAIDEILHELEGFRAIARAVRGERRDTMLDRLRELDAGLIAVVRAQCDEQTLQRLAVEADEELRPFRSRMPAEAYQHSRRACVDRLLRDRARLPVITYE